MLAYKLPPQPTRLRIQIWRKLQALGAIYIQDGVAVVPARDDLDENMSYIASSVEELGGSATLLRSEGLAEKDNKQIIEKFQKAADSRLEEILGRLESLRQAVREVAEPSDLESAEDGLKRERHAYLKARRLNFFGSSNEARVDKEIDAIRAAIDKRTRSLK
jgi:uncharacterized iron-regulated protein